MRVDQALGLAFPELLDGASLDLHHAVATPQAGARRGRVLEQPRDEDRVTAQLIVEAEPQLWARRLHAQHDPRPARAAHLQLSEPGLFAQIWKLLDANRVRVERIAVPQLDAKRAAERDAIVCPDLIGPGRIDRVGLHR